MYIKHFTDKEKADKFIEKLLKKIVDQCDSDNSNRTKESITTTYNYYEWRVQNKIKQMTINTIYDDNDCFVLYINAGRNERGLFYQLQSHDFKIPYVNVRNIQLDFYLMQRDIHFNTLKKIFEIKEKESL